MLVIPYFSYTVNDLIYLYMKCRKNMIFILKKTRVITEM